jgi:uncharacterized protein with ATP-grasp and redox domains
LPLRSDTRCLSCFRRGLGAFLERTGLTGPGADNLLEGYLDRVATSLNTNPPPVAGAGIYREIREMAAHPDIYREDKSRITSALGGRIIELRKRFESDDLPLNAALRASTWGNLLDVAQGRVLPTDEDLLELLSVPLAVDDTGEFLQRMSQAATLLILGDNAGETVLDRIFLEMYEFPGAVFYAVRPFPVLNDATGLDAAEAGLEMFSTVVDTGFDAPTLVPGQISPDMESLLDHSDLVLSKGQGNLEGLLGMHDPRLYYSFVVKCPVVAEIMGLPEGSGIFTSSMRLQGKDC